MPHEVGMIGDGSINGDRGMEIVTPPMQGLKAEKLIEKICKVLKEGGAEVDKSCGLHIHLDGAKLAGNVNAVKHLMSAYIAFEDVIMSFLPPSRRENRYSYPLRKYASLDEVERCRDMEDIESLWYRAKKEECEDRKKVHYDESRYRGLNLHCFFEGGHYEVRYHSGTINQEKIKNWASLHLHLLKKAMQSYEDDFFSRLSVESSLAYKTSVFFEYLGLPLSVQQFYKARQSLFSRDNAQVRSNEMTELVDGVIVATPINAASAV
jgi:hypothetical protein